MNFIRKEQDIEDIEVSLLLEGIFRLYGYDFRQYAAPSIRRRLAMILQKYRLESYSQLQHRLLREPKFFAAALLDLTVTTSELFRDPHFFSSLSQHVLPHLQTFPALRLWHAGCSSGEEVYSLAILLKEAGLYERSIIYATDINPLVLKVAKMGIYAGNDLEQLQQRYRAAGGKGKLSDYYMASYGAIKFDRSLCENILFAEHNLAIDEVFSETHVVLCRNVFIYFAQALQNRVLDLFTRSLRCQGFLCLGSRESLKFLQGAHTYEAVDGPGKIYRKVVEHDSSYKGIIHGEDQDSVGG